MTDGQRALLTARGKLISARYAIESAIGDPSDPPELDTTSTHEIQKSLLRITTSLDEISARFDQESR